MVAEGLTQLMAPDTESEPTNKLYCHNLWHDDYCAQIPPSRLLRLKGLIDPMEQRRKEVALELSQGRYDISMIRCLISFFDIFFAEFARAFGWPGRTIEHIMLQTKQSGIYYPLWWFRISAEYDKLSEFTCKVWLSCETLYTSVSALDEYSLHCRNFAKAYAEEIQRVGIMERKLAKYGPLASLPALHIAAALDDYLPMQVILKDFAARDAWLADPVFGSWELTPLRTSILLGESPEESVKTLLDYESKSYFGPEGLREYRDIVLADDYFCIRVAAGRCLWKVFEMLLKYELFQFDRLVDPKYAGLPPLDLGRTPVTLTWLISWRSPYSQRQADVGHFLLVLAHFVPGVTDVNGHGVLRWCLEWDLDEVVLHRLILFSKNVQFNQKDKFGRTPLSLAIQKGREDLVKFFVLNGDCDVAIEDYLGLNSVFWAERSNNEVIAKITRSSISRPPTKQRSLLDIGLSLGITRTALAWIVRPPEYNDGDRLQDVSISVEN